MSNPVFAVNTQDVVHESIDGETILINMATGRYYSLDGSGATIWEVLQSGAVSAQTIIHELATRYRGELAEIRNETLRVLGEMQAEGLIVTGTQEAERSLNAPAEASGPFATPVLNKYTDMEALLLLDPIHDVSPAGWPNKKDGG